MKAGSELAPLSSNHQSIFSFRIALATAQYYNARRPGFVVPVTSTF